MKVTLKSFLEIIPSAYSNKKVVFYKMKLRKFIILVFLCALFSEMWIFKLVSDSRLHRLSNDTVQTLEYRDQEIGEKMLTYILDRTKPAEEVGVYLLESDFGYQRFPHTFSGQSFQILKDKWKRQTGWDEYRTYTEAIWNDVKYFPVPQSTTDSKMGVTYTNSWGAERTYGGNRGHEGTDVMAKQNIAGLYPIVSMTDGLVKNMGWLEKGGYRIGIQAPSGAYFYYAHLDSYANLQVGDTVQAGDILGFMGDSGYGEEGTTGKFPVHLHVGIYIYPEGRETSVNPYWILRFLENKRVKSAYSGRDIR